MNRTTQTTTPRVDSVRSRNPESEPDLDGAFARRTSLSWALSLSLVLAMGWSGTSRAQTSSRGRISPETEVSKAWWPGWGGPNRDFKSDETGLIDGWSTEGPTQIWSRPVGDAYSGICVANSIVVTMSRRAQTETVLAVDSRTGKTRWEFEYPESKYDGLSRQFGEGPNATPCIERDRVYAVGMGGQLFCLDLETGKKVWSRHLMEEFAATALVWGYSSSPLIYEDQLIVCSGGKGASLLSFSLDDGSVTWKRHDDKNGYSSPVLIRHRGRVQLLAFMAGRLLSLDPKSGDLYWAFDHKTDFGINAFTPVFDPASSSLFLSSGYDKGSRLLRLGPIGGSREVEQLWYTRRIKIQFGNAIRLGDHFYFSNGHSGQGFLAAVHAENGSIAWRKRGYQRAWVLHADKKFFILDEEGVLTLARLSPEGFEELGSASLLGNVSWTPPALAAKTLYLRDRKTIMALDLTP